MDDDIEYCVSLHVAGLLELCPVKSRGEEIGDGLESFAILGIQTLHDEIVNIKDGNRLAIDNNGGDNFAVRGRITRNVAFEFVYIRNNLV